MKRLSAVLLLLLACDLYARAQERGRWASARERGLKGAVHTVIDSCSNVGTDFKYGYKYEFARDGKLIVITSLQTYRPAFNVSFPGSYKITKRNGRGDAAEASFFIAGELERKERYELEYDGAGNWTKSVTYVMREYEVAGVDWPALEWRAKYVCNRVIEYYP